MIPLTKIEGVPDKASIIRGMAYFSGTGPAGTTCGQCRFRGYYRESKSGSVYHTNGCQKFRSLSGGKHGIRLRNDVPSCRYFEKK